HYYGIRSTTTFSANPGTVGLKIFIHINALLVIPLNFALCVVTPNPGWTVTIVRSTTHAPLVECVVNFSHKSWKSQQQLESFKDTVLCFFEAPLSPVPIKI